MTLIDFFRQVPKAALAFSGGVDSAYLLHIARQLGCDVRPYFLHTPFQPDFELEDARKLAPDLTVLDLDILSLPEVAANPHNRCYYCKKAMFTRLKEQAAADGYSVLLDGTNASDRADDRPGMKALTELGVLSPLRLCGLTKDDIRRRSREVGLFTWNKAAYACLATRIPTDIAIDWDTLRRIESAEAALASQGFSDFRVRVFHGAARVQLPKGQFPQSPTAYQQLTDALSPYFDQILLDLAGR